MRRSHCETQELVSARVQDFLNGHASEAVLRASLKALGLDKEDSNIVVYAAKVQKERERTHAAK